MLALVLALTVTAMMPTEAAAQLLPRPPGGSDTDSGGNSSSSAGTSISKLSSFTGKYHYAMIGATESKNESTQNCVDIGSQTRTLSLPGGSSVVKAYLYWSGSAGHSGDIDSAVRLNGTTVNASRTFTEVVNGGWNIWFYGAFADVTSLVSSGGSYTVSHLSWHNSGSHCNGYSAYGGWSLLVVYEDPSLPVATVDVFDGFTGGTWSPPRTYTVTLNGLNFPNECIEAKLTMLIWEGDNYKSEELKINGYHKGNNTLNGSTDANLDIDSYNISNTVTPGGTSLPVSIRTWVNNGGLEWYIHNAFVVKSRGGCQADLELKFSAPSTLEPGPGDNVTFMLNVHNNPYNGDEFASTAIGSGTIGSPWPNSVDAGNVMVRVYVPAKFNHVSGGSFTASSSSDDGLGGTILFNLGTVPLNMTGTLLDTPTFTLQVDPSATQDDQGTIAAEIISSSKIDPDSQVDNLVVTPTGGPPPNNISAALAQDDDDALNFTQLPVELASFDALTDGNTVALSWTTLSETNNAGFEVQSLSKNDGASSQWEVLGFVEGVGTTLEAQNYTYRVDNLKPGRHVFRLKQVDYDGAFEYSAQVEVAVEMPDAYVVSPAYPNPFNPQASFSFGVRQAQQVTVELFNMLGQRVMTVYQGTPAAGATQSVQIDGSGLQSGMYLLRVQGENFVNTQVLTLIK